MARGAWEPRRALRGGECSPARIIEIEQRIRKHARAAAPPTCSSRDKFARDLVFRLLAARDTGGAPNYGKTAIKGVMEPFEHVGTITAENFVKVLRRKLGVELDIQEAIAIFKLYGHNEKGEMPYEIFCARLFGGDAKTLAKHGYRNGPFIWDRPDGMDGNDSVIRWDWDGMIRYPQCKNAVLPPSEWPLIAEPSCKLSKEKPDKYLKIEHIFGYSVQKSPNLYYNKNGDVVYFAAGAGVVYDDDGGGDDSLANRQKFFLRHDNDIECLAMHPDRDTVASGQFGVEPTVWIWSSSTRGAPNGVKDANAKPLSSPICLSLPPEGRKSGEKGERSVIACGFSSDGDYLATVSTDEGHMVRVWDWKKQAALEGMVTNAYKGEPPAVFGVIWNPYATVGNFDPRYPNATATEGSDRPVDFITFGIRHMAFWNLGNGELEKTGTSFGDCQIQDVLHACFLPSGHILTAGPNGSITIYDPKDPQGPAAFHEVKGAHEDRSADYDPRADDAAHMVIVVKDDTQYSPNQGDEWEVTVLSGGAGGLIKEWKWRPKEASSARPNQDFELVFSKQWDLNNVGSDRCPEIVALDIDPFDPNKFVAGSAGSDIWEVDDSPRVMVQGQSDSVYGLAAYPRENVWGVPQYSSIYASGCEDGCLYLWDSRSRECLHALPIRRFDDHKPDEQDPELRAKDAGFPRNELLKVRAVEWSSNGDQLVLTTCGVVGVEDDDDLGGVIQVYAVDERWFMDDDQIPNYDSNAFLLDYRVWEAKDCNAMIDDCKFSPDGRFIAAGCHDSNIYVYEVLPKYVGPPTPDTKPFAKTFALSVAKELRQRVKKLQDALNAAVSSDDNQEVTRDTCSDNMLRGLLSSLKTTRDTDIYIAARRLTAELGEKFYGEYCVRRGYCAGHSTYVSHIEWTVDSNVLQSTSGDSELLYWDVKCPNRGTGRTNHGRLIPQLKSERSSELGCAVRDMQWAGWSCLQGFPVMGMWQDGQCGNDINSCHRSPDGQLLVTSDDEGYVRIFNYPCVIKEAPHHAFKGHAAFTENVRFLQDGDYADSRLQNVRVVSAGGGDRCLIQWRLRPVPGCGDKQVKLRRELQQVQSVHNLQQAVEDNELMLQEKEKELKKLKLKLALSGASVKGSVALRRSMSMDSRASQSKGTGIDLHKLKAEFSRMAKKDGGGRGKIQLPAFQLLMNRLGWAGAKRSGANQEQIARRLFRAFDRSGDGKLSLDELEGGLLLLCAGGANEKADFMFSMIDTDGDGTISQPELEVFVSGFFVLTEDTIDQLFTTVEKLLPHPIGEDKDGSTRLAVQRQHNDFRLRLQSTVVKVLAQHRASIVERAMATADVDNDGEISAPEWYANCAN